MHPERPVRDACVMPVGMHASFPPFGMHASYPPSPPSSAADRHSIEDRARASKIEGRRLEIERMSPLEVPTVGYTKVATGPRRHSNSSSHSSGRRTGKKGEPRIHDTFTTRPSSCFM